MDELPTIIQILKGKSEAYQQAFHQRALELERAANARGQFKLAALYGEIVDAYLDAFETLDGLELEDCEPLEVQHDH